KLRSSMTFPSMTYLQLLTVCLVGVADACMKVMPPEPGMPSGCPSVCRDALISVTQNSAFSKAMSSDLKDNTCTTRTFTCNGPSASILVNGQDFNDGPPDDAVKLPVTCNKAAVPPRWEFMGAEVTQVECTAAAECPWKCADDLIMKVQEQPPISKPMDGDVKNPTCTTRKFTCIGDQASITLNGVGNGEWSDEDDGNLDGMAIFEVMCNAEAMPPRWEFMNAPVTKVDCTAAPAAPCADDLIMKVMETNTAAAMSVAFAGDTKNAAGERVLTCSGRTPSIVINTNMGEFADANDGAVDGTATFTLTCDPMGPTWEYMGAPVTKVDCTNAK
ncbi:hypothetical protein PMAYCL1PPCAC_09008, partial [Pristionchus mayeri]